MSAISQVVRIITNSKLLLYSTCFALILIISMFVKGRKVTLKRRKSVRNMRNIKILSVIIEKIPFALKLRNKLSIDLAVITKKEKRYNLKYAEILIVMIVFIFCTSLVLSIILLRYAVLVIFVPILSTLISIMILLKIIEVSRKRLKNDIPEIILIFTSKFAVTENVLRSLQESMKFIPDTHKYEFTRLITAMASAEDYVSALEEYKTRINDPFCDNFVELLKTNYIRNENILQGLVELQTYIATAKKIELTRHNELYDQRLNLYLGIVFVLFSMCLDIYLLGDFCVDYYFETFGGLLLTIVTFSWIIISLLVVAISERT